MASAVVEWEMPGRAATGGRGLCCADSAAHSMAVPPGWLCSLQLLGHYAGEASEPEAGRNPSALLSVVSPADFSTHLFCCEQKVSLLK